MITWLSDIKYICVSCGFSILISVSSEFVCDKATVECIEAPIRHIHVNLTYVSTLKISDPENKRSAKATITKADPMKIYPEIAFNDTNYSEGNVTTLIIPVPVVAEDAAKAKDEKEKTCAFTIDSLLKQAKKQLDECSK